jgi:hypothetical protein
MYERAGPRAGSGPRTGTVRSALNLVQNPAATSDAPSAAWT